MKYPKLALLGGFIILASPITHAFPDDGYSRPYQPITPAPVFIQGPPDQANMLVRQLSNSKNNTYILPAIPSTTNWGYFDAGAPPALSIKSGDTVMIETLPAGGGQVAPGITEAQIDSINNDPDEMNNLAMDPQKNAALIMAMNQVMNQRIAEEVGIDDGRFLPIRNGKWYFPKADQR